VISLVFATVNGAKPQTKAESYLRTKGHLKGYDEAIRNMGLGLFTNSQSMRARTNFAKVPQT
jgi:hypothetical protein